MTISLARRQKLAAIAKAHDEWVQGQLAAVVPEFDPAAHPMSGSDYNQHNVDVDASGVAEDELAAKAAAIFGDPLTAAGDPDWDESEHPRGPDGRFIDSADIVALEKQISGTSISKNIAYMKGESYQAQALQEEQTKLEKQLEDMKAAAKKQPSPSAFKKATGKPITAWTKTIYSGKYKHGEVVAVKNDDSLRLVWDAKNEKFELQKKSAFGGWALLGGLSKKDTYNKFKSEKKSWLSPVPDVTVIDDVSIKSPGSKFNILPRGERGKSGDGYFAPGFWGKYGAAGIMMRHVDENGIERFLLVQANMLDNPNTFKKWQLPGGALEEFETPEQGAAREVFEELGFDQDFLNSMKQRETHKVTFNPAPGEWSYSNITVDVPSRPAPKFDPYELGDARWFTAGEIAQMRAKDEIIAPLEANFDSILHKFHDEPAVPAVPKNQPLPPPPPRMPSPAAPSISQSSAKSTIWTKGKFNQSVAYKHDFAHREVVGLAVIGGETNRILWENGKFRFYRHKFDAGWQYEGTFNTKKEAISVLKDVPFYRPPKGTMADINNDYIPNSMLSSGNATITANDSTAPDVLQSLLDNIPAPSGSVISTKPWPGGASFGYKTSFTVHSDGVHIGALHENEDGSWKAIGAAGYKDYLPVSDFSSKPAALKALQDANDAYQAAKTQPIPKAAVTKKLPKLTAAQIEKQNGKIPKSLKLSQISNFMNSFHVDSPVGFITSGQTDMKKVLAALVYAVKTHNATQSPKLNYLQGINVADQYNTKNQKQLIDQKSSLIAWLKTSEGKALAPIIIADADIAANTKIIPAKSATGVRSAYEIGTPQKNVPKDEFDALSLSDAIDMHEEMYKNNPLTSNQIATIRDYVGSADEFNEPLRGNYKMHEGSLSQINELQSAMRPVPQSFTVWRGTYGLGSAINSDTIYNLADLKKFEGAVVGDPAFLSTAISKEASFSGKFKLIIDVPKGTPATFAYAQASPSYHHEKEMLLAAGLQFKINRVEETFKGGADYSIYMTVIPEVKKK